MLEFISNASTPTNYCRVMAAVANGSQSIATALLGRQIIVGGKWYICDTSLCWFFLCGDGIFASIVGWSCWLLLTLFDYPTLPSTQTNSFPFSSLLLLLLITMPSWLPEHVTTIFNELQLVRVSCRRLPFGNMATSVTKIWFLDKICSTSTWTRWTKWYTGGCGGQTHRTSWPSYTSSNTTSNTL